MSLKEHYRLFGHADHIPTKEAALPQQFHTAVDDLLKRYSTIFKTSSIHQKRGHVDEGSFIIPMGALNLLELAPELRERVDFALGDSLDQLTLEVARDHKTKARMSRITLIAPTALNRTADRITARADGHQLTFSTTVNSQQQEQCEHNEPLRQTLCKQMIQLTNTQLTAYIKDLPANQR